MWNWWGIPFDILSGPHQLHTQECLEIFVLRKWANKYALSEWFTWCKTMMTMHFWAWRQMAHALWIIKGFVKNTQQLRRKWRTRIKPERFNILMYFLHISQLISLSRSTPSCMEPTIGRCMANQASGKCLTAASPDLLPSFLGLMAKWTNTADQNIHSFFRKHCLGDLFFFLTNTITSVILSANGAQKRI